MIKVNIYDHKKYRRQNEGAKIPEKPAHGPAWGINVMQSFAGLGFNAQTETNVLS